MIEVHPMLKFLINPFFIKERRLLRDSEKYSNDALQALKMRRLKALCKYAYKYCDYYREIFNQAGFNPDALRYFEQMQCLPFLTKDIIRKNLDRLTTKKINRKYLEYVTTGGSTGSPLGLYLQKYVTYPRTYAYEWRQYNWGKISFFDRRARIRGFSNNNSISFILSGTLFLSPFHLTEKNALNYVQELEEFCPRYIEAFPSAILFLSKWLINRSVIPRLPELKAIFLSSETVTIQEKKIISTAFAGVKVFNKYGNSEQATMIGQCELGNMHEFEEHSFTEYLNENGEYVEEGQAELVSTSFINEATVLIRYKTDDLVNVSSAKCPCGRSHRMINSITGRKQDYFLGSEGQRVSIVAMDSFHSHASAFDGLLGLQYYQDVPGEAVILVVCENELPSEKKEEIIAEVTRLTAGLIKFSVRRVDKLVKTSRGKSLHIIMNCKD